MTAISALFFLTLLFARPVPSAADDRASAAMEIQKNIQRSEQVQNALAAARTAESLKQADAARLAIEASEKMQEARRSFEKGLELKGLGQYPDAEREFLRAIEMDPSDPDYHFELAGTYAMHYDSSKGRGPDPVLDRLLGAAQRELEQTVALRPDFTAAHFNLGIVLKRKGEFERSREAFRKVIELDPNRPGPWIQIGEIYEMQGFFDEAESAYETALQKDYHNPEIRAALEDLKINRENSRRSQRTGSGVMQNPWRPDFYPSSYSQQMTGQPGGTDPQNQNVTQALPYLGTMLMQEFMRRRAPTDEN